MKSEEKDRTKQSKAMLIEWRVCEDDRDWQLTTTHEFENPTPVMQPNRWMTLTTLRWVAPSLLILVTLVGLGGWWLWYSAQMGLAQIETELQDAAAAEAWLPVQKSAILNPGESKGWQTQIADEAEQLSVLAEPGELLTKMEVVDLGHDWAVVQVVVQPPGSPVTYRQTRVYQQMAQEWRRIAPTAAHWGRSHQLDTRYFTFHYYSQDAAAVKSVAERLDILYPTLYAAFFSDPHGDEKLVIRIDPALSPRELPLQTTPRDALVLASPAATLAPVEMAVSDQLAQAVVLALIDKLAMQASRHYNLPPHWSPLRNGLRLWLVWEQELPLSIWRQPVVRWVFWESPTAGMPEASSFHNFAHALCAQHHLWMRSPMEVGVPIACVTQPGAEERIITWRYPYNPPLEAPFPLFLDAQTNAQYDAGLLPQPAETLVMLTTVVEYAATTYGSERLPVLLAALAHHTSWETLLPAVFGVSATEFESGWRAFVADRYRISR